MRDMNAPDLVMGVVGAGAMGGGIAQVAAQGGIATRIFDTREGAAAKTIEQIAARLERRVGQGKMDRAEADAAVAKLAPAAALDDLAGADVVVEAVVEDLAVKRDLFARLESIVAADSLIASNTSSIPIGAIAAGLDNRGRVAGLHFFNPVPVMKLVEVVRGADTTDQAIDQLTVLGRRLGRTPVVVKDTPGFLVNFGGRAFTTEGLAILAENVARPEQIDAVMRDGFGFRMGPFELMDLTGIDVNYPVSRFVHESFFADPRLKSTPLHRYMMECGRLGRKAGQGFFRYTADGAEVPSPDADTAGRPAGSLVLAEPDSALSALIEESGAAILESDDGTAPIIGAPIGEDATAYCLRLGLDHRRFVAVDIVPDLSVRVTLMTAPGADRAIRQAVIDRLATIRKVTAIADSPGFVGQRMAAMVANLGCEMAQLGLAAPADIDTAMRLGLNYPRGPLELAEWIGLERTHRIMTAIQAITGDDRYRPSPWLRRRALLGLAAKAE